MTSFTLLESIIFMIFQCITLSICMMILEGTRYDKRDILHLVCFFIIPSILAFYIVGYFAGLYFIFYFTVLYKSDRFIHSLQYVVICIINGIISDHTAAWITIQVHGERFFEQNQYLLYFFLFIIFMTLLTWLVRTGMNRMKRTYILYNRTFVTILSLYLIFTLCLFYFIMPWNNFRQSDYQIQTMIYMTYFIASVIVIGFTARYLHHYFLLQQKSIENEHYYAYTKSLEEINTEMRKFKHDYVNILSSLRGYMDDDDMDGLRLYFNEHIYPLKANFDHHLMQLHGLEKIHVSPLKGLITSKVMKAQEAGIPISVEVLEPIETTDIYIDIVDLTRAIGIILDNAIEASLDSEHPIVQVALIRSETSTIFVVSNPAGNDMPNVHTLYEKDYSTKGESRGIGLFSLKEISMKYPNIFLDTSISGGIFIQKMEVIKEE